MDHAAGSLWLALSAGVDGSGYSGITAPISSEDNSLTPILLMYLDCLGEVRVRIGDCVTISRNLHALCRNTHFLKCISEAGRSDDGDHVGLLRRNEPRVRYSARKEYAFSGCQWENFPIDINPHLARKKVEKLIFS